MRTIVFGAIAVLTSWMAAPSAQQPPSPSTEPAHKIYVMTGCLEGGPESTSTFKLTGAKSIGQAPVSSGVSTATSKPDSAYELQPIAGVGEDGINRERLQSHVGKRVEVTVRPVELSPGPSSPSSARGTAAKPEQTEPQRYTVVKINQLAESCR